jgi:DNA-binding LacI/PurR family transcriptional regulator
VKAIMKKPRETWPTAIVCSTDRLALSAIAEIRKHHIQVPQDISIIGCDDITEAAEGIVPLTTVRLPTDKLAFEIWTLLEKKLKDPGAAARIGEAERILIPPELVIRESTRSIESE